MKKYYDKIIILLGCLVLGASIVGYQMKEREIKTFEATAKKQLQAAPEGAPWTMVASPKITLTSSEWPLVKPQSEDGYWFYQLFTSPKIWVDADGKFVAEPPFTEGAKKMFGLAFGDVKKTVYPIKYVGVSVSPNGGETIQLKDESTGNYSLFGVLNQEIVYRDIMAGKDVASGLTIKSFSRTKTKTDQDIYKEKIVLTLFDANLGKEITIEKGVETYLEDMRKIVLNPDAKGGKAWEVSKVGDTMTTDDGACFTIKALDFNAPSVDVEKTAPHQKPASIMMRLTPGGMSPIK